MIKVDYSYSVNLELAGIGNPTLNVCGKYECSSSDDNTLKGEIPIEILNRIMDANNSLTAFFLTLNEHVEINKPSIAKYSKDYSFKNALKYNKNEENKPFLHFLRRTKMTEETFSLLRSTMDIPVAILNLIQSNGMTLVRTDKIEFRKEITAIMNEHGFKI